jgi:hypothetical protein
MVKVNHAYLFVFHVPFLVRTRINHLSKMLVITPSLFIPHVLFYILRCKSSPFTLLIHVVLNPIEIYYYTFHLSIKSTLESPHFSFNCLALIGLSLFVISLHVLLSRKYIFNVDLFIYPHQLYSIL